MSIASSLRILHDLKSAEQVWNQINQTTFPKSRCTTKIVKYILLKYDTSCNMLAGYQVFFRHKSLGAGVHEVWMESDK